MTNNYNKFDISDNSSLLSYATTVALKFTLIKMLKCNSSPEKHVFFYLFPDCLCIIIHFSAYPTTIRARVLCLFAQVCKRKNPISEPSLDLAVILVTSRYEDNTLSVNPEQ